jgi:PAS domain-containing protein
VSLTFATAGSDKSENSRGRSSRGTMEREESLNGQMQMQPQHAGEYSLESDPVSISSSGQLGDLSNNANGMGVLPAALSSLLPRGGAMLQQHAMSMSQHHAPMIPSIFAVPGIPGAGAPPFGTASSNAAGASIGMALAPASGGMSGQKRRSEDDLSESRKDDNDDSSLCGKAPRVKDEAELERMTPAERRRYERNLREQQRSYRISQQIKQLRDVLEESKIPFKPNKFSILVSVVEYIKQSQTRAIMLDAEHQKLIDTIRQTTEMVNSGQVPSTVESSNDSSDATNSEGTDNSDLTLPAAKDLDFEVVFQDCPCGMAVCSLDGRVLGCNTSFESSLGVKKDDLVQQSMFVYIRNHQDIFEAMADLLKRSSAEVVGKASHLLFWCGHVMSLQNRKSALTITLSSSSDGNPKYFTLTVAPPRS